MHTGTLTFVTSALLASTALGASIPGLPACASGCVTSFGSCGTLDVKCICSDSSLLSSLACCVSTSCDAADQETTIKFADALCEGQGVTDLPTAATCASTATASASSTGSGSTAATGSANSTMTSTLPASLSSALASASSAAGESSTSGTVASSSGATTAATTTAAGSSTAAAAASATNEARANGVEGVLGLGLAVVGLLAAF